MCVLWACIEDRPDEDTLRKGFARNSDGAGVAWIEKKQVRWVKGLNTSDDFVEAVKDLPLPFLAHCRMASAGGPSLSLTHPFPIQPNVNPALEGTAKRVLAHNGHWAAYESWMKEAVFAGAGKIKLPGGHWSDTRVMAWLVQNYGLGMLSVIPAGNKIVVLDGDHGFIHYTGDHWHINDLKKHGYYQSSDVEPFTTSSYLTGSSKRNEKSESEFWKEARRSRHLGSNDPRKYPYSYEYTKSDGTRVLVTMNLKEGKEERTESYLPPYSKQTKIESLVQDLRSTAATQSSPPRIEIMSSAEITAGEPFEEITQAQIEEMIEGKEFAIEFE